jgi:hypothetical protein
MNINVLSEFKQEYDVLELRYKNRFGGEAECLGVEPTDKFSAEDKCKLSILGLITDALGGTFPKTEEEVNEKIEWMRGILQNKNKELDPQKCEIGSKILNEIITRLEA